MATSARALVLETLGPSEAERNHAGAAASFRNPDEALGDFDPLSLSGTMAHEERFIPPRQKLDQLSVVKDYAAVPRLEYR